MSDLIGVIAATWPPAETLRLGPWTLRRGAGGGKRVSAATLDGPLAEIEAAEAAMRAWGQAPLVLVQDSQPELDAALAARGYLRHDETRLLTGDAAEVAGGVPPETALDCDAPLACMTAIWDAGGIGAGRRATMARTAGPRAWLLGRADDAPAACAFVALDGDVAMLHALEVAPAARGRGLGEVLTRAAAAWAAGRGASTLALVVTEANAPARALYRKLGLSEAARYHYRGAEGPDFG